MPTPNLVKRDSFFDNFRAILIFLVVFCHLVSPLAKFFSIKFIYRLCYIFHMPAMLFISGFFFKSSVKDGKLVKDKIFNHALLYLVFQVIFTITNGAKFSLYQSQFGLWYIQVLIIYCLIVPILDRLNPTICIALCFLAGLGIGVDRTAGHIASLSRAVVFLPFFMIGYYLDNDVVERFKAKKHIIVGILAFAALAALYYVSFDALPKMLDMSSGKASYAAMRIPALKGMAFRAFWYVAALAFIVECAMLTPKRHTFFSYIGKNSLSVFIIHLPLCIVLRSTGFYDLFAEKGELFVIAAFVLISAAVCFIAGSKPFFWPFKKLMGIDFKFLLKKNK